MGLFTNLSKERWLKGEIVTNIMWVEKKIESVFEIFSSNLFELTIPGCDFLWTSF